MANNHSFLDFIPASKADWKERVLKELKGKEFDSLVWDTGEGFQMDPLYTREEVLTVVDAFSKNRISNRITSGENGNWMMLQAHKTADLKKANRNIITSLELGIQGIVICSQHSIEAYNELFQGVNLNWISVMLDDITHESDIEVFLSFIESEKMQVGSLSIGLNYDPLNAVLVDGNWLHSKSDDLLRLKNIMGFSVSSKNFKILNINGALYGDHGASMVNELAYSLALYHEYMIQLIEDADRISDHGLSIINSMQVTLSVGQSYFLEIAKIKAFRIIHAQLLKVYELEDIGVNITSRSCAFDLSPIDQYSNLLRLTTQAMAAGIGGADAMLLATYNNAEDEFSQRMSTNIQNLLIEESALNQGVDVSSGSYAIEKMVVELANNSWSKFQQIEHHGGWLDTVEKGELQKDIKADAGIKIEAINSNSKKKLGLNDYKNTEEKSWLSTKLGEHKGGEVDKLSPIIHQFK